MIGKEAIFGIRPEDIYDALFAQVKIPGENMVKGKVEIIENLGGEKIVHLKVGDIAIQAKFPGESRVKEGQEVEVVFDMRRAHVFKKESGEAIF
ncbi:TOBE domain-containing protein [Pyrococcus sp. ST04]|uniref:TOBE domain-containing protein n=1 Tax=Pyrococcus sp. ST04 TaxID=1183377 RepID=UPI001ED8CB3B|nr:TOBE domain-containing protein [Pyrococcus sp. ST04]